MPAAKEIALQAVGALLFYVQETQKVRPAHLSQVGFYEVRDYLVLDETTRRNLELFENLQTRGRKGSLLDVLDKTGTPMGGRMLKRWMSAPLMDLQTIEDRLDGVGIGVAAFCARSTGRGCSVHQKSRFTTRVA